MICFHTPSIFFSLHSLRLPHPNWFLFGSYDLFLTTFLSLVPVFLYLVFAHRLALAAVCRFLFVGFLFVGFVVFTGL